MNEVPHRILVIDDNPEIHEDFRKVLCTHRSVSKLTAAESFLFGDSGGSDRQYEFRVDSAFQAQEGLARVYHAIQEGYPYEVAFVDVRMPPGLDGIEVTPRLWIADPSLHIVICTAYSDYTWEQMFEKVGVPDRMFVLKNPFDREEVLQLAHGLITKRMADRSPAERRGANAEAAAEKFQTAIFQLRHELPPHA